MTTYLLGSVRRNDYVGSASTYFSFLLSSQSTCSSCCWFWGKGNCFLHYMRPCDTYNLILICTGRLFLRIKEYRQTASRQYPLIDKMLISLRTILTYQFLLLPSESNQRPCDVLLMPNVIGPARNAKMIGRCHTSNKSDERTLECEDTDTLRGDTLGK